VIGDFARIEAAVRGRPVTVLGNGPTARQWDGTLPARGAVATVNAGLALLAELSLRASQTTGPGPNARKTLHREPPESYRADLVWVQDERFLPRRAETLLPHLEASRPSGAGGAAQNQRPVRRAPLLAVNERLLAQLPPGIARQAIGFRMLGYEGFSRDPRIGVFHGYNAIFGLLQLLAAAGASSLELYGVPMLYWSTETRFDQAKRGVDVDLHRASDQVALTAWAIDLLRKDDISITVHGESALKRATLPGAGACGSRQ
jgi:hypothetical protein